MTRIRIPGDRLPENAGLRHARLRDYFCDKDARASRTGLDWTLELYWPGGDGRHVDPRLEEGLESWGGISEKEMWCARERSGRVLTSLYDSWTLLAWSEWLSSQREGTSGPLTVLHVDDHRDLGSPRLFLDRDGWLDPFTGSRFDLLDPASVESAIESGALGMGSFLTAFLRQFPAANVWQLTQAPKVVGTHVYRLELGLVADDLIAPDRLRSIAALQPASSDDDGNYRITDDLARWLEDLQDGPILLHIDMDHFSNRYDGDADWEQRSEILDPPLEDVLERIAALGDALRSHHLFGRIVSAAVAYSPGFFPAEYWRPADAALRTALKELYA